MRACTRGKVIGCVCLCVCLSTQKNPDPGRSISAKYLQTVQSFEKLSCLCFFLLDTLYKCLKSCVLSWHYWHTYQPHPGHMFNMINSLGFTNTLFSMYLCDDSFLAPRVHFTVCICGTMICSNPHGRMCIAVWRAGYVLDRALSSYS